MNLETTLGKLISAIDIHMSSGFPIHRILYQTRGQAVDALAKATSEGEIEEPARVAEALSNLVQAVESNPQEPSYSDRLDFALERSYKVLNSIEDCPQAIVSACESPGLKAISALDQLPNESHMEPKLRYCWWWNRLEDRWEYCDARQCDHAIYTHWLPQDCLPYPS